MERSQEEFGKLLSAARRQRRPIAISIGVTFLLAVLFLAQSVSKYTAETSLLIDSKQVGLSATSPLEGSLAFDTGAVDSQVLVLQSDRIAAAVADHLDLAHNPDFVHPAQSVVGGAVSLVGKSVSATARFLRLSDKPNEFEDLPVDIQRILMVDQLQKNLKVTRNARTYVLTVDYTDANPALARSIAAAYAQAYLEDQLESRFETTRRAATWLEARTREVKSKADTADQAVQAFRAKNNLTEASGRLITEQALTDANTQLSVARNDLNSAQAKYDRLQQIVDAREYTASSVDALANPIISKLRSKYLDSSKLNADISARLGPEHQSAVNARKEMEQYRNLIFDELSRLLQSYRSEVQIATDRVGTLERSIEGMRKGNAADSAALSKLRTLEQEAQTYNTLYATYLQKAQDLLQQQSLPISDARVITDAALPIQPSSPKTLLVLIGSLVLGALVGGGIAALREFRERGYRTATQIRNELGLDFVAYVPELPASDFERRPKSSEGRDRATETARPVRPANAGLELVLDDPMSRYSESMRALKLSTDHHFSLRRPLVIGFVSMFPNEGKSTAAKNFASLVAAQGERVLLIDADLRNPQLTRDLTPSTRHGLLDLLHGGEVSIDGALHREERSGLSFLPGSARGRVPSTGDVLASPAMVALVKTLRSRFDLIVVDLPPLGAVLDAVAAASFIDGYHLLVEWGRTPRDAVRDILAAEPIVASRTIGVTLTKVQIEKLEMFDTHATYGYVGEYLSRYYHRT